MERHAVLVVGGGNAGISLSARLLRDGVPDVTLLTDEPRHVYRPLLNYVGAGEASMTSAVRSMEQVVPEGCTWVREAVMGVNPGAATVQTGSGRTLGYDTLVLCPGLTEDWEATPGLREGYDAGWAASTFVTDAVPAVWSALQRFRAGRVVFTVPPEPAPCGVTALKPLLMACDHWRRTGVLDALDVHLVLPTRVAVGVARADRHLDDALGSYGVHVSREASVVRVDHRRRSVVVATPDGDQEIDDVAFAHVVPHYRAPRWIASSALDDGSDAGLVAVDPRTLRHRRHPSIWSLGDAAALGIRPSGGALRPQVEVLAHNLTARAEDLHEYDGYTVAPVTVSRRRLLLVEVDREGRTQPSVPVLDLLRPRLLTWLVDRYLLPVVYFRRILRGKV